MIIRPMAVEELSRLSDLDRSEQITRIYHLQGGTLFSEAVQIRVPRWSAEAVAGHCRSLAETVGVGGGLWGAFDGEVLAGIAVLGGRLIGPAADEAVLAFMHVSAAYRERGARLLYISATPSDSAIGFYTSCGARPAARVDPELFALEPEDIHLALPL
jgi:hypothetical protein